MITIKPRTIVGRRCLIVYQDEKPMVTIWEETFQQNSEEAVKVIVRQFLVRGITAADGGEILDLVQSIAALKGTYAQLSGALQTYLHEKLNEKGD